jgi:hypothetical protein
MKNLTKEEIISLAEKTRSKSVLWKLLETDDEDILNVIKINPISTKGMKEEINKKTSRYSKMLKYSEQCKTLSNDELNEIIENTDDEIILTGIVFNEESSSDILNKIVDKTTNNYTLECILRHKNLSSDTLNKIVDKTNDDHILLSVLEHKNLSSDTLNKIIEKHEFNSLSLDNILKNEITTSEHIEKIIDNFNKEYLLEEIAKYKNANTSILNKIVDKTNSKRILKIVENNKNASLETLCKIEQKQLEIEEIQSKRDVEFNKDKKMLLKDSLVRSFIPILCLNMLVFGILNMLKQEFNIPLDTMYVISIFCFLIFVFTPSSLYISFMYEKNKIEYYFQKGWL